MKKSELADIVAAQSGASKKDTEAVIDAVGAVVAKCPADGEYRCTSGLGQFQDHRTRSARRP